MRSLLVSRLRAPLVRSRNYICKSPAFSTSLKGTGSDKVTITQTKSPSDGKVKEDQSMSACGVPPEEDDDYMEEEEEMFVEAHDSFGHKMIEWGGPRRGGKLPEPTRFGDWERKGRCTDF